MGPFVGEEAYGMSSRDKKKQRPHGLLAHSTGHHSTVIEKAIPVLMYVQKLPGFSKHTVGLINPRGGGGVCRVTCRVEKSAIRMLVKGSGSQSFYLYFQNGTPLEKTAEQISQAFQGG